MLFFVKVINLCKAFLVRTWYTYSMSKKLRIILAILFVVILIVLYVGFVPADRYIQYPCPSCSTDTTNLADCGNFLNTIKDNSDAITLAKTFGVTLDNISKMSKTVSLTDNTVTCRYYGQSKPLL